MSKYMKWCIHLHIFKFSFLFILFVNKVYIRNGLVHIVPPGSEEDDDITVDSAVNEIRKNSQHTVASLEIQNCIANKIKGYPEAIKSGQHRVNVFLPIAVAAILKHKPNLISPAVRAFCDRDPIDIKACRAMRYFPPEIRVRTSVTLTKCMYAMLVHSKYNPDRKTGWNLPTVNSLQFKAHNLGMKIACGFEILTSHAKHTYNIEDDKDWKAFVKSLTNRGYFRDLVESSQEYTALLNSAQVYYEENKLASTDNSTIGREILDLMRSLEYSVADFKNAENSLPLDDDDSWLNVTSEEIDKILEEHYGQKRKVFINKDSNASEFAGKISSFLNHVSDLEGMYAKLNCQIKQIEMKFSYRNFIA